MTDLAQLGLSLNAKPILTGLETVDKAFDKTAARAEAMAARIKTATAGLAAAFKKAGTGGSGGGAQTTDAISGFQRASAQIRALTAHRVKEAASDANAAFKTQLNSAIANSRAQAAVHEKEVRERVRREEVAAREIAAIRAAQMRQQIAGLTASSGNQITKSTSMFNEPVYTASGIASVDKMRASLAKLKTEEAGLHAARAAGTITGAEYARGMDSVTKATNLAVAGNTRARGVFRQTASAIASATFEITGAIFGITSAISILASPAIFGFKLLRELEDTKLGMAAILISMGEINGEAIKLPKALELAGKGTKRLQQNAMKFGVDMTALAQTTKAVLASGLGGGLNLKEVEEIALVGSIAVKTIGLDAKQSVQEIRDLVAGGIQAGSSTLAVALGIGNDDVKRWREAGTLFVELKKAFVGFADTAILKQNTLNGAWTIFVQKLQLAFANSSMFDQLKAKLTEISNAMGSINEKTGEFEFNPALVKTVEEYWTAIKAVAVTLFEIAELVVKITPLAIELGKAFLLLKAINLAGTLGKGLLEIGAAATAATGAVITGIGDATGKLTALKNAFNGIGKNPIVQVVAVSIAWEAGQLVGGKLYESFKDFFDRELEKINKLIYNFGGSIKASIADALAAAFNWGPISRLIGIPKFFSDMADEIRRKSDAAGAAMEAQAKRIAKIASQYDSLQSEGGRRSTGKINGGSDRLLAEEKLLLGEDQVTGKAQAEDESDALKKTKSAYDSAIKASQDFVRQIQDETAVIGATTAQQTEYQALKIAGTMRLAGIQDKAIAAFLNTAGKEIAALDKLKAVWTAFDREFDEAIKGQAEMVDKVDDAQKKYLDGLTSSADAVAKQVETMRLEAEAAVLSETSHISLAAALELVTIKRLDDAMVTAQLAGNTAAVEALQREIDKRRELASLIEQKGTRDGYTDALKNLNEYLNPAKAKSFGDALANSFGKAGTAIGKMAGAFDNYSQKQTEFNKVMAKLSPEDRIKNETKLSEKQAEIQVGAYADMAGAAKSFFDEGTTGYKGLAAAEQGFRAIQLAMSIASMIQGATETTASVAQSGTKAVASAAAGVAKAFEQMGVYGFIGAAAIIAFMASMGVKSGGGGASPSMSAVRQEEQGTGTVLGDPSAKSNSLSNALEMLVEVNTATMQYSARMAKSLQNIEIALTGVSSMIFRTPGLTSGNMSGLATGEASGFLGFSGKKTTVGDSGLTYSGVLSGIEAGLQMFTDILTEKSSWWGLSKKTSTQTVISDAPTDISRQFGLIYQSISDSLVAAGSMFGKSADILETQIANIEIDLGMVSLKGLKGDELKDALNAVISASADDIAKQVLPGLEKYQKVGEGYYETAVRVAYSTEVVHASLKFIGKGFAGAAMGIVDFSQELIKAFGDLETLTDAIGEYYENYFSEQERFADSVSALNDGFANIGLLLPKTKEGFRAIVDSLDLTTQAGADTFASLMALAPAFAEVADAIAGALADVNSMFNDSIQDIQLSIMSPEQQYDFWRTKLDTDLAALAIATDPNEIARLAGLVNRETNNAYGLLEEDQKKILAPEFIAYLEKADALATDRLNASQANIIMIHQGAADAMEAVMMRVAEKMMEAAQTPLVVSVEVTGNVDATVEVGP